MVRFPGTRVPTDRLLWEIYLINLFVNTAGISRSEYRQANKEQRDIEFYCQHCVAAGRNNLNSVPDSTIPKKTNSSLAKKTHPANRTKQQQTSATDSSKKNAVSNCTLSKSKQTDTDTLDSIFGKKTSLPDCADSGSVKATSSLVPPIASRNPVIHRSSQLPTSSTSKPISSVCFFEYLEQYYFFMLV